MAAILREVLNAQGMKLTINCSGQSYVGLNLSGTWTGKVSFNGSFDGIKFFPLSMTPFASGATVQSATGNGNWFIPIQNYVAVQVSFDTLTTGTVAVTMATSIDSSYQDAFLVSTSKYVNQEMTGGSQNQVTIAAQANRAWKLRTLVVSFSTAPGAAVPITISDGASATIWKTHAPASAGAYLVLLPADMDWPGVTGGGVVGTPGNSMVITVGAPGGSVTSEINAELYAN